MIQTRIGWAVKPERAGSDSFQLLFLRLSELNRSSKTCGIIENKFKMRVFIIHEKFHKNSEQANVV